MGAAASNIVRINTFRRDIAVPTAAELVALYEKRKAPIHHGMNYVRGGLEELPPDETREVIYSVSGRMKE